ncbi:hypothetical protein ACFE04_004161 [Oxalis oulophora]
MSLSSIFIGSPLPILPKSCPSFTSISSPYRPPSHVSTTDNGGAVGLNIECSSRPQKKATAHHRKTRPRKTQAWDIKRKLAVYPPMPELPPDFTILSTGQLDVVDVNVSDVVEVEVEEVTSV